MIFPLVSYIVLSGGTLYVSYMMEGEGDSLHISLTLLYVTLKTLIRVESQCQYLSADRTVSLAEYGVFDNNREMARLLMFQSVY